MRDWLSRISAVGGSYWVQWRGEQVPARLLNFEKHRAVLQPYESDEAIAVPRAAGATDISTPSNAQ